MARQVFSRPAGAALVAAGLAVAPAGPVGATENDGYVMGAGRWSCAEVAGIVDGNDPSQVGQLVGWILGYWSAATFARETGFVDIVEQVGGRTIFDQTLTECRSAPGETLLHDVTKSMIANTK